jgi:hypothetical protein
MKLCSRPKAVAVILSIAFEPGMSYMSMLAFDHGTETLGMVNDRVAKVLKRNREEHFLYMKEHRAMEAIFNKALRLWLNSRQDITSILATPEVGTLREAKRVHSLRLDCGRVNGTCTFCTLTTGRHARRLIGDI